MSNLIFSLNATMPIFLTMILGLFFRKVGILDKGNTKDRRTAQVRRLDKFASCTSLF